MSSEESERAECNMEVLVKHDRAEIDKWMLKSVGNPGRRDCETKQSRVDIIIGKKVKGVRKGGKSTEQWQHIQIKTGSNEHVR